MRLVWFILSLLIFAFVFGALMSVFNTFILDTPPAINASVGMLGGFLFFIWYNERYRLI